jgi:glycosyltransferase involved in cell wall biosynthesis
MDMGIAPGRLFHAPYSVDNATLEAETQRLACARPELCGRYGLDPDLPTFLFCGKLTAQKRVLSLLEAFLGAGLDGQAQLLYVGEGAMRTALERSIEEAGARHVRLIGFLNQSQMPLAYVLGQVLCLISEGETWGLVVNEALASGRPVIVTETVGCAPDLVGAENGWTISLHDPRALALVLREAFQRRAEWPEMGLAGRRRVAGHTYRAMAQGIEAALASISA